MITDSNIKTIHTLTEPLPDSTSQSDSYTLFQIISRTQIRFQLIYFMKRHWRFFCFK